MKQKGFTLIELLVVISIIGMLSSIILASLNSARAKARDANRVAQVKQLQNALEIYYNDHGDYPGNTSWFDNSCDSNYTDINTLVSGYITLPKDPSNVCMYYTSHNGIGGGWAYNILFVPENSSILPQGGDCPVAYTTTNYCKGVMQ